ncbi:putative Lipoprotein [Streptomyces viridochromogenes Tue57]|uniref:Putative Lipoprotein n=2 Tax=Streptomyces viridochromogenes TaxID=1938 RepID=L8PEE2_STRVR|nr:putative Lipoprotein [Streptomyces viridochromogenes Tue57]
MRRAALAATATAAALVLAACGGNGSDTGSGTGSGSRTSASASADTTAEAHNDQDVAFAQGMIPHHQQALEMAGMAATQASSAQVKDLASRIEKAQDPEIRTMSGWLESWGEDVPSSMPGMDHSGGHSGGSDGSDMPGMMDTEDMDKLKKASGEDFDTMFLTMMIEHHEGAVEMAGTEKEQGRYGPAKKLADAVITAQTAEIAEMNKLLGKG